MAFVIVADAIGDHVRSRGTLDSSPPSLLSLLLPSTRQTHAIIDLKQFTSEKEQRRYHAQLQWFIYRQQVHHYDYHAIAASVR